jgi:hypothetical protein
VHSTAARGVEEASAVRIRELKGIGQGEDRLSTRIVVDAALQI